METYELFSGGLAPEVVEWLYGGKLGASGRARRRPLRARLSPSDVEELCARAAGGRGAHARRRPRPARRLRAQPSAVPAARPARHRSFGTRGARGCRSTATAGLPGAIRGEDGEFDFRAGHQVDVERAADAYRRLGGGFGELAANTVEINRLRWQYAFLAGRLQDYTPSDACLGVRYDYHPVWKGKERQTAMFDIGTGKIVNPGRIFQTREPVIPEKLCRSCGGEFSWLKFQHDYQ